MIYIVSSNKALKSVWIRKYLNENSKGKGKLCFDAELEKLGGQTVFRGNLDIEDSKKLANSPSPCLKEILEIWSELNYQGSIETVESFLTQSLWYNSLIRVMDKPFYVDNVSLDVCITFLFRAVWGQSLAGYTILCSWARHFTVTVPLSTWMHKWALANSMLGVNPAMD